MRISRPPRVSSKRGSSKPVVTHSASRSGTAGNWRDNFSFLFKALGMLFSGGTFILGLIVLMSAWKSGDWLWNRLTAWTTAPQPAPQVDVRSIVVKQVQDASDLTTAIFTMEAVVPTQQDATVGGMVVGSTKLLYIAHGEVRAGIDLSKISVADVQASGDTLTVKLPAPKLLDSKIDVGRSSVYDYNRGALGLGPDVAPQLQSLAQKQALEKITTAACDKGILTQANDRAKLVIGQLLKVPAYKNVAVQIQTPDLVACKAALPVPNSTPSPASSASPASVPSPASSAAPTASPIATPMPTELPKVQIR
jgi:Protein of unknown function (DUF4230)